MVKRGIRHSQAFSIAAFVAISAILLFTSAPTPTANAIAIQTISIQQEGAALFFEVKNVDGLKDATALFSETIKNAKITFEEVDRQFDGILYSAIMVESTDLDKIEKLDLTLRIKKKRLQELGLDRDDIKLYIKGVEQETAFTEEDEFSYYYSTTTVDMGLWIIGKKIVPIAAPTPPIEVVEEVMEEPDVMIKEVMVEEPVMEKKKGFFEAIRDFFSNLFGR